MSASVQADLSTLMTTVLARGSITAEDVAALRAVVFPDGIVSREEAEAMFALNEGTRGNHSSWGTLFIEALTDYFVWQTQPRGYVDEAGAQALLALISRDGHVDSRSELELIVNVCHWAQGCPDSLRSVVLSEVRRSVLAGGGVLFGPGRRRADVVDRADVAIVRKLIYAAGGAGSLRVTRAEADLLFDINDATIEAGNDPGWQDLFVRGVASYLMFPQGEPKLPGMEEARQRDRWLAERRGIGGFLGGIVGKVVRSNFAEAWRGADLFGERRKEDERAEAIAAMADGQQRGAIDAEEAAWILDRIGRDDHLHENETQLLQFITVNATGIHASLRPLLAKAGVGPSPWSVAASVPAAAGDQPAV